MIHWFRHLPYKSMDESEWRPFIHNDWFREHYMKFVYLMMAILLLAPMAFERGFAFVANVPIIPIIVLVFIIHEVIHILVIYTKGDISLTFKGIFFWLHTNATLSKTRFWLFMSLPFILLSVVPGVAALFVSGTIQSLLLFICWINFIISSSDVINSLLILIKPNRAVFCNGKYRVTEISHK
uniref:DUF3267 domain-containing protein n=1 Tax=Paenibacillus sp. FSL H8-0537 TaxID=2921399 RepID=UPI004054859D